MDDDNVERILFLENLNADSEALEEIEVPPDAVDSFIACQKITVAIGGELHARALSEETSRLDRDASRIYKAIAKNAEGATPKQSAPSTDTLHKRASGETRIEKTVIGSTTVCAELVNGVCVKTYIEGAA